LFVFDIKTPSQEDTKTHNPTPARGSSILPPPVTITKPKAGSITFKLESYCIVTNETHTGHPLQVVLVQGKGAPKNIYLEINSTENPYDEKLNHRIFLDDIEKVVVNKFLFSAQALLLICFITKVLD
jgi:hypothetical protein